MSSPEAAAAFDALAGAVAYAPRDGGDVDAQYVWCDGRGWWVSLYEGKVGPCKLDVAYFERCEHMWRVVPVPDEFWRLRAE